MSEGGAASALGSATRQPSRAPAHWFCALKRQNVLFKETRYDQTAAPLLTNELYKVETWTEDGKKPHKLLYAGNLQRARTIFAEAIRRRRKTRLTVRRGTRVLDEWSPPRLAKT
jgi:hypothetical protein